MARNTEPNRQVIASDSIFELYLLFCILSVHTLHELPQLLDQDSLVKESALNEARLDLQLHLEEVELCFSGTVLLVIELFLVLSLLIALLV